MRLLFVSFKPSCATCRESFPLEMVRESIIFVLFSFLTFPHPFLASTFQSIRFLTIYTRSEFHIVSQFPSRLRVFVFTKPLKCCEPLGIHLFPGCFLTGCCTSALTCVAIGKLNSLVSTSASSIFEARQNLASALLFMLVSGFDAGARSSLREFSVARAAFMNEVQDKVKRSGAHGSIEISSQRTRVARVIPDLSATVLDSAFGELGRRRLTRD